jgi:putative ABC transport system permease protein
MSFLIQNLILNPLNLFGVIFGVVPIIIGLIVAASHPRLFMLVVKNLGRNRLRTALTFLAIVFLVFMVIIILTVVTTLDSFTTEKARNLKLIVTERWQLPSQMPLTHADYLDPSNPKFLLKGFGITPNDFMTWSFYGGTLEPGKVTLENLIFFFVMDPKHIRTMMDDLETFDPVLVKKMQETRQGCLVGRERLEAMNKRVGERFKVFSINYKEIDLEFEIVGVFPEGRYNKSAIMNDSYFNEELDKYARQRGKKHPLDMKRLNLIWLRVKDRPTFEKVAGAVESASQFADLPVKCETASSGVATFIEPFKDLLWAMKMVMVPAILISMALVVANAISISVRERQKEMAVLKVLGYRPTQILGLVLGESLLVGALAGLLASAFTYYAFNSMGGIPFPMLFFQSFPIPGGAFLWGMGMGVGTALVGSLLPAWSARSVKVSEVFSKVA